jgi:hypothetical protein
MRGDFCLTLVMRGKLSKNTLGERIIPHTKQIPQGDWLLAAELSVIRSTRPARGRANPSVIMVMVIPFWEKDTALAISASSDDVTVQLNLCDVRAVTEI